MTQHYATKDDFVEHITWFLYKNHMYDNINFGIRRLNSDWLQVINKNALGDVTQRLWKIRYREDNLKDIYKELDEALKEMRL